MAYEDLLGDIDEVIDLSNIKSVINDSFYSLLSDKKRYEVLRGGAGSGKSYSVAQKLILRILKGYSTGARHTFLCLRKTLPAARKSILPMFKHIISEWHLENISKLNKTEMTFLFSNGSQIIITGLDDPEKIKSIFGITSIWLEESNEFTKDDFNQLDLRMRGVQKDYYQIVMSFNPVSKNSWLYTEFFEKTRDNATLHHSTYLDNRFLDDDYKQKLEDLINQDTYYYTVYTLGNWGILEGIIFENWTLVDEMPSGSGGYAVDFGFNNPSAIVEVRKKDLNIYIKEIFYETKKTNKDLIRFISKQLPARAILICDNAEPDRIKEFKDAGIRAVPARKGKSSVLDGIDLLKRHKLHITKDSLNVIKEISGYRWKEKKDIGLTDSPVEVNDHSLDAIRYYCWTVWGKKESQLKIVWI